MLLSHLIEGIKHESLQFADCEISGLHFDSRTVKPMGLFVCQTGTHVDGHNFIDNAVANGAIAIVCSKQPSMLHHGITYIITPDCDYALGTMASRFFGNPSAKLKLIGITGTNGKTTTVTLLHRLFRDNGMHAGLISTIVNRIDDQERPATHTTPDAIELNRLLADMVQAGCTHCFMEVSSHAIVQQRIAGLTFAGAIFSNITHDHLDFHKTMANYIAAKKTFFDNLPSSAFALTNIDDRNGAVMLQNTKARKVTYSLQTVADYRCKLIDDTFSGLHLELDGNEVWCRLVGRFNAYNLTAIYATATLCGIERQHALTLLSQLTAADGRFQHVDGKGITAIVDYAHTPDALQNVLNTINHIRQSHQRLIVVVGCGGDRDPLKRPLMAQIAAQNCQRLILTSDNPRTENPEAILDQMEKGLNSSLLSKVLRIPDRHQAIKSACMMAQKGDIILVAGKGHETYQEINGVKHHFDDREELSLWLQEAEPNA